MIRRHFVQITAVLTLFLVLGAVLSYFLLLDMSTPKHMKELRKFDSVVSSCETASAKADADYAKGIVKMYFGMGIDSDEKRMPYTFYKRLEKDYGIEIIYTGDLIHPYIGCYNLKMDSLLSEKIGRNTLDNLYKKMHREQYPI